MKMIIWEKKGDPEFPYIAEFEGHKLALRVNNFPENNFYTLIVDDQEIFSFDDLPKNWKR